MDIKVLGRVGLYIVIGIAGMPSVQAGSSGTITVQGTVTASCDILDAPATVALGNLAQSASKVVPFDFYCNAPFKYSLGSLNGALAHSGPPTVVAGSFNTQLAYNVAVSLPTDGGSGINETCSSTAIKAVACHFADSGTDTAIGTGSGKPGNLTLSWTMPGIGVGTPFLAGAYGDTLTLTIGTQP